MTEAERLRGFLEEIKRLASNPFASEVVALRACLLAANEALGLPGPQPSPERDIARAVIKEIQVPDSPYRTKQGDSLLGYSKTGVSRAADAQHAVGPEGDL